MNKTLFTLLICLVIGSIAMAQNISENALGLRLGDNNGFGVELNYQRGLSQANRLELGLGIRTASDYDGFKLTGIYQWVWVLDGNFNWYAGAGGGLGSYSYKNLPPGFKDNDTFFFAAGSLGVEYNFDFPLILSLDVRPEIGFGSYYDDFDFDLGLGLRYQF